jgi:hypothetical protein
MSQRKESEKKSEKKENKTPAATFSGRRIDSCC